jgi:cysteine desulfurase/selenocysteine lyase
MPENVFRAEQHQKDFPILQRMVHQNKKLVYLDNAATSQKPNVVIDAIAEYYRSHNANVHRGIHQLGDESTKLFHQSRQSIANFFGAEKEELIVVRNTTEAVNQVAYTWGEENISAGDRIIVTEMEHHSNVVPWQLLATKKKAHLDFIQVNKDGRLDLPDLEKKLLQTAVKLIAFSHVSNTLGTVNPVAQIVGMTHRHAPQAKILIDGAQAAPHLPIHFKSMNVDFYVVSAHKMIGPMGIGALLIKKEVLENLPPFLVGGGMIDEVSQTATTYAEDLEERFTAGTPDVAGLVGWAAACSYLQNIGMKTLLAHDQSLVAYSLKKLQEIPQISIIGPVPDSHSNEYDRVGSVAFVYQGVHAHDVGQILDSEGVAVRSGHHCTMPLHTKFQWPATVRISFQLYNTTADIDAFVMALEKVKQIFGK